MFGIDKDERNTSGIKHREITPDRAAGNDEVVFFAERFDRQGELLDTLEHSAGRKPHYGSGLCRA